MNTWFVEGVWASKKALQVAADIDANKVEKITVIRHAALGDMMLVRPFLIEVKKAFPNAVITLSIVSNYTLGTPDDLADKIHVMHGSDKKDIPLSHRIRNAREIGPQDIIFDLAATNRSSYFCLLNKAKLKIGFPYSSVQAKLIYDIAIHRSDMDFEVTDTLKMLNIFGICTAYPHQYAMLGEKPKPARPYIVYFMGASVPDKCWPTEYFSSLIDLMAKKYPDHDHRILEGIKEWETAKDVLLALAHHHHVSACRTKTVDDIASLMKGADLLVSNDTGVRHVAIACHTPTVGIFAGQPFRYWPRYDHHEIALKTGSNPQPSVDDVFIACNTIMDKLSNTEVLEEPYSNAANLSKHATEAH